MNTEDMLHTILNELKDIKSDVKEFKAEMGDFKVEMSEFKSEMLEFKEDMLKFKERQEGFKQSLIELSVQVQALADSQQRDIVSLLQVTSDNLQEVKSEVKQLGREQKRHLEVLKLISSQ